MVAAGLRFRHHLPKQVRRPILSWKRFFVLRWFLVFAAIAVVAAIAGYVVFNGGSMGH
jgi:hypothetical protein